MKIFFKLFKIRNKIILNIPYNSILSKFIVI